MACYLSGNSKLTHPPICCIYALVNRVSIGSDNGLSPVRHQAIIWTNAAILSIGRLWTNFSEILIKKIKIFIQENASESIVCEMAAILSSGRWVDAISLLCKTYEMGSSLTPNTQFWLNNPFQEIIS